MMPAVVKFKIPFPRERFRMDIVPAPLSWDGNPCPGDTVDLAGRSARRGGAEGHGDGGGKGRK